MLEAAAAPCAGDFNQSRGHLVASDALKPPQACESQSWTVTQLDQKHSSAISTMIAMMQFFGPQPNVPRAHFRLLKEWSS
jgi:hypothetical protein